MSISGVDLTVDGWTTLGVAGGNTGINVGIRDHRFVGDSPSTGINITNNTINNPSHGVVMNQVLSATINGNVLSGNGGHPASGLFIANVPGNSTYSITNNTSWAGLNIGKVDNPGMALTLEDNVFDGSVFGAILNVFDGSVFGAILNNKAPSRCPIPTASSGWVTVEATRCRSPVWT